MNSIFCPMLSKFRYSTFTAVSSEHLTDRRLSSFFDQPISMSGLGGRTLKIALKDPVKSERPTWPFPLFGDRSSFEFHDEAYEPVRQRRGWPIVALLDR